MIPCQPVVIERVVTVQGKDGKDGKDAVPVLMQIEGAAARALLATSPTVQVGSVWVSAPLPTSLVDVVIQVLYESKPIRQFGGDGIEAEHNFGNVSLIIDGAQELPFVNLSRSEAVIHVPFRALSEIKIRFSARTTARIAVIDSGMRRVFYRIANAATLPEIYV
jgi:hypothetical protein